MEGYVVQSEKGTFLSKTYYWFPHDRLEESWIHTLDELRDLDVSSWKIKPSKAYPAKLDDSGQTVITGLPIDFNKLVCVVDKTVF